MRIRASNLLSLVGKLHARLSKLHATCTKEKFEKKLMLEKKVYCFITFEFQSKYVRSFCESTARWSKLHSTSTDDPSEKKEQISWKTHKFLFFFENSSVKFTEFVVESSCTVVKTALYMYEGTILEKVGVGENRLLFLSFWSLIKICSDILRRSFGTVFKSAFHVYRWSSRERRPNLLNNT